MRIAIAGQAFFREDNGQAAFTVRLCRELAAIGHEVIAFAPSHSGKASVMVDGRLRLVAVPAIHLAHNANVSYLANRLVKKKLAEFLPDIVHLQDHYFLSRTVFRHACRFSLPVVGSNHFLPGNLTDNLKVPPLLLGVVQRVLWRHMKSLYNRLLAISTPTRTAAEILAAQNLIPPVTAISCGVDVERFRAGTVDENKQIRTRYHLTEDVDTFIYVGRIDREKGLATMVRAMAMLPISDVRFIIGGKGSFAVELQQLIGNLNLQHRVLLPGFIPGQDLPRLLAASDWFVMAGHVELQSIASLEAMACGLPVLAADAAALPELVTPGVNGELFAPGNAGEAAVAIDRILGQKEKWKQMGRESRKRALQHSLEATVAAYETWYRSVIAGG